MKKMLIAGVVFLSALFLAGVQQSYAYQNVTSSPDGGCLQCHAFAGGSGTGHTTHSTASVTCGSCHPGSTPGKNVTSDKCIVCHPVGNVGACNLVNLAAHPKSGVQSCVTCHTACAPATTAAECADWKGSWKFTYDNTMTKNICFDNTSFVDGSFELCDNASKANCTCLDNITSQQFCVDNTTFTQCDNDTIANCKCIDNPFYIIPSGPDGQQDVVITQAVDNLTLFGNVVPCTASGTRGTTPVTIVQVDNATAGKLGIASLSYIVFEGASFDNVTFSQILPENFTKDNDSTDFVAEELFNFLGLVSGIKSDNDTPPVVCDLKIFPKTFRKLIAIVDPFQLFIIRAERDGDIEFSRPIDIDWETEAINDLIKIRLGKKIIFGIIFVRPFQLEPGEFTVTVTYGDPEATACGKIEVK